MEFNKPVSNPLLIGAMELLKAEENQEHKNLFFTEMVKSKFLAPVIITPEPVTNEAGELQLVTGSKIQFPMLSDKDGKTFFMAFTDKMELKKWKEEEQTTFAMTFEDYAEMLFTKDPQGNTSSALGFVINPFGANMIIPRELVAGIMQAKMGQANSPKTE